MGPAEQLDARLAAGEAIAEPVAVVVAHPDDELLSLGTRLPLLQRLQLVHVTDGAPRDMEDAQREGFTTWQDYAAARRRELRKALQTIGAEPVSCIAHDYPDKEVAANLVSLTRRLVENLADVRAVITHPYEQGHPDHDGTAFAVHAACAILKREGKHAPQIFEFASYHLRDGEMVRCAFWPDSNCRELVTTLSAQEHALKSQAMACFVTQQALLSTFPLTEERLRRSPAYDFTEPAPPGAALYDSFGWRITSEIWRAHARLAQKHLRLEGAF